MYRLYLHAGVAPIVIDNHWTSYSVHINSRQKIRVNFSNRSTTRDLHPKNSWTQELTSFSILPCASRLWRSCFRTLLRSCSECSIFSLRPFVPCHEMSIEYWVRVSREWKWKRYIRLVWYRSDAEGGTKAFASTLRISIKTAITHTVEAVVQALAADDNASFITSLLFSIGYLWEWALSSSHQPYPAQNNSIWFCGCWWRHRWMRHCKSVVRRSIRQRTRYWSGWKVNIKLIFLGCILNMSDNWIQ